MTHNELSASSLFRRLCWEEVDGYDEGMTLSEDWDFWIRLFLAGWQAHVIPESLFYYRLRKDSLIHSAKRDDFRNLCIYFYNKHRHLYQRHFWAIMQRYLCVLLAYPYKIQPRYIPYYIVLACKDQPMYRLLRFFYFWLLLPVYRVLKCIRDLIFPKRKHS